MEILFNITRFLYVLVVGFIITMFDIPFLYQTLFLMLSMLLFTLGCVQRQEERLRLKNHIRFCVSVYLPVAVFALLLWITNFFALSILILFVASFITSIILFFIFRKQYYVPYFLLTSNMTYTKAKEESKRMVKMNKMESFIVFLIYIELLMVCNVVMYTCMQTDVVLINLWMILPILLIGSYFSSCANVHIHNNEHSAGRFTLKAFFTFILIVLIVSLSLEGMYGVRKLKSSLCKENEVSNHFYEVAVLKQDYKSKFVYAKKTSIEDEELSFLIGTSLPVLPVNYEVYYVSDIEDLQNKDSEPAGLTLLRMYSAQSYITSSEDTSLEHVFYHEYAHVLFHYMKDYKELLEEYEKLRVSEYTEKDFYEYYASTYALTSVLEDMCEEYTLYIENEDFRNDLENMPVHKKKCELLRKYLLEEYGYDMYGEEISQPVV